MVLAPGDGMGILLDLLFTLESSVPTYHTMHQLRATAVVTQGAVHETGIAIPTGADLYQALKLSLSSTPWIPGAPPAHSDITHNPGPSRLPLMHAFQFIPIICLPRYSLLSR